MQPIDLSRQPQKPDGSLVDRKSIGLVEPKGMIPLEKEPAEIVQTKIFAAGVIGNIEESLDEIKGYYQINKEQAKSSFRLSIATITAGFATVVAGIFLLYAFGTTIISLSSISGASGILLNFIGAACLYYHRECVKRLNDFHDKLIRTQRIMLAATISEQIEDSQHRDRVREQIVAAIINDSPFQRHEPSQLPAKTRKARENLPRTQASPSI